MSIIKSAVGYYDVGWNDVASTLTVMVVLSILMWEGHQKWELAC
jgi:hypothetical protein